LDNGELFHFHENPNNQCPVGSNIHLVLDDKLDRVENALFNELESLTVRDVINDTYKYAGK